MPSSFALPLVPAVLPGHAYSVVHSQLQVESRRGARGVHLRRRTSVGGDVVLSVETDRPAAEAMSARRATNSTTRWSTETVVVTTLPGRGLRFTTRLTERRAASPLTETVVLFFSGWS